MSMMVAGASLAMGGAALGLAALKKHMDTQEAQSKAFAKLDDVISWDMLGQKRDDERGWPVPAFVYGSMHKQSHLVYDWPRNGVIRHALISMPSGAGKTWTAFYPTLMFGWTHSCVVHVRKKEMADLTAGRLSLFSDVIWLDPTSMGSAKYNPLDRLRVTTEYAFRDAQNFIENLSSANGQKKEGDTNAVFLETAKDFASAAVIFWLTHAPWSKRNLTGLREAFADCTDLATRMLDNVHPRPYVQNQLCISASSILNNPSERFIGNVEGLMRSWLRVYQDEILATVTSRSDFTPEDLVSGPRPVALFVHLPPSDDERLAPFVNLLVSQIIDDLMTWEKMTRGGMVKRWQLAWILDEAWRLGKIRALEGALADMRSYGMRAMLGFQGLSQVIDLYGPYNSVFNNCRWITGWQNGFDECKHVADMLGEEERDKRSTSTSYGNFGPTSSSVSKSMEWRPVVQAAHVSNLPKDRIIIFGEEKPIFARRTHPDAWQKLIRPVERPERFRGNFLPGPAVPPPVPMLPDLRRYLPAPVQLLLPPPKDGGSPPPGGGNGPSDQPPPRPRRPRRRL